VIDNEGYPLPEVVCVTINYNVIKWLFLLEADILWDAPEEVFSVSVSGNEKQDRAKLHGFSHKTLNCALGSSINRSLFFYSSPDTDNFP
jgi:hypothetical protein